MRGDMIDVFKILTGKYDTALHLWWIFMIWKPLEEMI